MNRDFIAMGIALILVVFNLIPDEVVPVFEVPIVKEKIEFDYKAPLEMKHVAPEADPELEYIEVKAVITYYTAAADECGNSKGITASGKKVSRGMIAAPKHIPFGTKIEIDGKMYVVEDRGGAIKVKDGIYHFDVYVPTKKEAFKKGRQVKVVKIYAN